MLCQALRVLTLTAAVLSAPIGWADDGRDLPEKDTPADLARRQREARAVVAGSAVLVVALLRWGRDLAVMLRRLWAVRQAPVPPWQESAATRPSPAGAGWTYHPPPEEPAAQQPAQGAREDADATVQICRRRKP